MKPRGDVEVELGSLGVVVCRPGLRALEAIDSAPGVGSLTDILARLSRGISLRDAITIVYETHLDFSVSSPAVKRYTRAQIGEAILEVGLNSLKTACWDLVFSAYRVPTPEDEAEGSPGNA